ncbi:MAG: hypothetical protein MKZ77_02055 [Acidimicrobiales bacterium]|nr:hypothetical protein [Acidimicrobiales bacterium]
MTRIIAYVPNLMDRSRFGETVEVVQHPSDLASVKADLILVDLSHREVLDHLPAGSRVIGFAPHIDDEILKTALARGCTEALPRSIFFRRLPDLIGVDDA